MAEVPAPNAPTEERPPLRQRLGDRFGLVLVAIVATYLATAILDQGRWSHLILVTLLALVQVLVLRATEAPPRARMVALGVLGLVVLVSAVGAAVGPEPSMVAAWSWAALSSWSVVLMLRRLVHHRVFDMHSVLGVVSAYLMLGLMFSAVYRGLDLISDDGFFAQEGPRESVDFTYFSFVTLTTLGFGDLTPQGEMGKVLVTIEALLGQVFLVTVVAAVVGNLGRTRDSAPPEL